MSLKDKDTPPIGRGHPPRHTKFRKGQSGNPRGRPKDRHREAPYEAVLGQLVTVREAGAERRITAAEAFLLHLTKRGLEGDHAAARSAMNLLEDVKDQRRVKGGSVIILAWHPVDSGSVNFALRALRMASLRDGNRPSAHMLLEPWIVQAALERLGDGELDYAQRLVIVKATRTPHKVKWPKWWVVNLKKYPDIE